MIDWNGESAFAPPYLQSPTVMLKSIFSIIT